MAQHNTFLNGDLSDRTSLIHLLDKNDSEDNKEAHVIKHSSHNSETDFSKLLVHMAGFTILSLNIQYINAKLDEFQLFVNKMNLTNPTSVICFQECWLSVMNNVTMFNLDGYELFSQPNQCCAHGDLIIYVHKQFAATVLTNIKVQLDGNISVCTIITSETQVKTVHPTLYAMFTEHPMNLWMILTLSIMNYLPF